MVDENGKSLRRAGTPRRAMAWMVDENGMSLRRAALVVRYDNQHGTAL